MVCGSIPALWGRGIRTLQDLHSKAYQEPFIQTKVHDYAQSDTPLTSGVGFELSDGQLAYFWTSRDRGRLLAVLQQRGRCLPRATPVIVVFASMGMPFGVTSTKWNWGIEG